MLAARHRKAMAGVFKSKLVVRHLWYSIASKKISRFFSRASRLPCFSLPLWRLCSFALFFVPVAEECKALSRPALL